MESMTRGFYPATALIEAFLLSTPAKCSARAMRRHALRTQLTEVNGDPGDSKRHGGYRPEHEQAQIADEKGDYQRVA